MRLLTGVANGLVWVKIDRLKVEFGNELRSFSFTYLFWYGNFFFSFRSTKKGRKKIKEQLSRWNQKVFFGAPLRK